MSATAPPVPSRGTPKLLTSSAVHVRVSLRSGDQVDVSEVSERLGGGGHRFAGGFTSYSDLLDTMALVRKALAAWADLHMLERGSTRLRVTGQ
jgi:nanoRNase/pAp phosphatase (c-di-AMP/oligoRNAs hydrolase)